MKKNIIIILSNILLISSFNACADNNSSSSGYTDANSAVIHVSDTPMTDNNSNESAAVTPYPTKIETVSTPSPTEIPVPTTPEPSNTPMPTVTSTPTPEPTPTILAYGSGTLKVGTDIPEGEYIVFATDGWGGYFSVNSDANGDDILFNGNFDYCSIITVYSGEYLELSRARAYPFDQWCSQNTIDLSREGAMYKIGITLSAGEYLLTSTDEWGGYYCIYPDSRQQDIIANDNFENQTYVSVSDGQYLELSRCMISQ